MRGPRDVSLGHLLNVPSRRAFVWTSASLFSLWQDGVSGREGRFQDGRTTTGSSVIQRGRSCNGLTGDRFIVRAIVRSLGGGTRGWSPEEAKKTRGSGHEGSGLEKGNSASTGTAAAGGEKRPTAATGPPIRFYCWILLISLKNVPPPSSDQRATQRKKPITHTVQHLLLVREKQRRRFSMSTRLANLGWLSSLGSGGCLMAGPCRLLLI